LLGGFQYPESKGRGWLGETPEIVSHVIPFQCTITPRSSEVVNLIQVVEREYPFEKGGAEILRRMEY
jgi:hypothetical protein